MENQTKPEIIADAPARRRELILDMKRRAETGSHCGNCSGVCCTFLANSMQITPVEARDLKAWLLKENRWNEECRQSLRDCVRKFRLDQDAGDGRRTLRKTYTCPFYRPGPLGCSISPKHKPYGCLAFNARRPGITDGGDCASDLGLLAARESTPENDCNARLREEWRLPFEKAPIPVALLALPENA